MQVVTRCRCTASKNAAAVNVGRNTWVPPTRLCASQLSRAAMWNSGAVVRVTPPGSWARLASIAPSWAVSSPRWLIMTPLGTPVVPPV